jgi:hypothetical protein
MLLEAVSVGTYTVHLAFGRRPLDATQLLRGESPDVLATNKTNLEITP